MEYISELRTQYQVGTPEILINKIPEKPMWTCPPTKICQYYVEAQKQGLPAERVRADFLAHLESHRTEHIYTDGSKTGQHVGFGAVLAATIISGRLTQEASIFTAELYAIRATVQRILNGISESREFTIFSDSRSALMALRSDNTHTPIVDEMKDLLCKAKEEELNIELCWVPGHMNVEGNEKADKVAKEAALKPLEDTHRAIPHTDMRAPLREAVMARWHRKWNALDHEGRKLREIKTDVKQWPSSFNRNRRKETVLSRLRLGHTNITHAYLMQGQSDPP